MQVLAKPCVSEERQDVVLQDPVEVLQAVVEHERDLAEEAVPYQGGAAVAATATHHDHKVQKPATGPDAPAEVTDVHAQRPVAEAAAAFHANKDAAEAGAQESRVRAEEAEHIGSQEAAAAGGAVAAAAAALEESRSAAAEAEALSVAGRDLGQRASTIRARAAAKEGLGFDLERAEEELFAPARFRDAEVEVPKLVIDHAPSRPLDQRPLVLALHSGTAT